MKEGRSQSAKDAPATLVAGPTSGLQSKKCLDINGIQQTERKPGLRRDGQSHRVLSKSKGHGELLLN